MNTPIGGDYLPALAQIAPPSPCAAAPFMLDPCTLQVSGLHARGAAIDVAFVQLQ